MNFLVVQPYGHRRDGWTVQSGTSSRDAMRCSSCSGRKGVASIPTTVCKRRGRNWSVVNAAGAVSGLSLASAQRTEHQHVGGETIRAVVETAYGRGETALEAIELDAASQVYFLPPR